MQWLRDWLTRFQGEQLVILMCVQGTGYEKIFTSEKLNCNNSQPGGMYQTRCLIIQFHFDGS